MGKDDSTPSPAAQEPADAGKGLVAPEGQAQSDLVLKKAHELLNDPAALKDLEDRQESFPLGPRTIRAEIREAEVGTGRARA